MSRLKTGTKVAILEQYHKWVSVSFVDPADGLPVTGWIMKKYVSKTGVIEVRATKRKAFRKRDKRNKPT
jgi:hypothetical protein